MRLALILVGLVIWLVAAAPAVADQSEFYGVTQPATLTDQDVEGIESARVHIDRFPLSWRFVESSEGVFDWARSDALIGELASHGIRSLPILWQAPEWAGTGGAQRPPVSPSAQRAWEDFLRAAMGRYGRGGTYWATDYEQQFGPNATPLPVTSWQVWNEPNLKFFFPGGTYRQKVQRYADLLRISHDAIKAVDPGARVVLGGMAAYTYTDPTTQGWDFLDSLYGVPGSGFLRCRSPPPLWMGASIRYARRSSSSER